MFKRIMSFLLALCLLTGMAAFPASGAAVHADGTISGNAADGVVEKTGTFKYSGILRDVLSTYYYDDAYFRESSYTYDEHLATMSLCLALTACGSEDILNGYSRQMINSQNLLSELGFIDFDHNYNDFSNNGIAGKPTKDSIGVVAANKVIWDGEKNCVLIAVAVRGGGYESEWASNLKLGESGQHAGFGEARDQVIEFLRKYIKDKRIAGDVKLWITGYSRAAAAANMVAGRIDEGGVSFPDCTLALADLYAYTFETPAGAMISDNNGSVFGNIFNIINPNDLVPKVAPAAWSFARYGVDRQIPTAETQSEKVYGANVSKMLARYTDLEGAAPYMVDGFSMKKISVNPWALLTGGKPFVSIVDDKRNAQSQNAFLNSYITMLTKDYIKNRTEYVAQYQEGLRDICGIIYGTGIWQGFRFINAAADKFSRNFGLIAYDFLKPNFYPWTGNENDAYARVAQCLRESLHEAGITGYSQKEFDGAVVSLMDLVIKVLARHPDLAATLVLNVGGIAQAHLPEVSLAWMQSMDSNYTPGGAEDFASGKYRIVRVNCPANVDVYDGAGSLVASIVGDAPQTVSSIVFAINEDGEKLVYLPPSDEYSVIVTATEDNLMTYSINEYDPQVNEINRLVNYNDVPMSVGQQFTGEIPAYTAPDLDDASENASSAEYVLITNGDEIPVSGELSGEDAAEAYFTVNAAAGDSSLGIARGSGTRQLGVYAQVEAVPFNGAKFLGWYNDADALVSAESEYRFRIESDVNLTAKFESVVSNDTGSVNTGEGYGNNGNGGANNGAQFGTVVDPDAGVVAGSDMNPGSSDSGSAGSDSADSVSDSVSVESGSAGSRSDISAQALEPEPEPEPDPDPKPKPEPEPKPAQGHAAAAGQSNPFADVAEKDWFFGDVMYVYGNGLMGATSNRAMLFSPDMTATRGMVVAILHRLAGMPEANGLDVGDIFSDAEDGQWYSDAVKWAAVNGIVSGVGAGRFAPDEPVSRQDFAVILMNYLESMSIALPVTELSNAFADETEISDYAREAIRTLNGLGVINGDVNNTVNPKGEATRAEVAAMFHRLVESTAAAYGNR